MTVTDVTPKPTREFVLEWVCGTFNNFPEGLVRNAWTKTGYAWFDKEHVYCVWIRVVTMPAMTRTQQQSQQMTEVVTKTTSTLATARSKTTVIGVVITMQAIATTRQ